MGIFYDKVKKSVKQKFEMIFKRKKGEEKEETRKEEQRQMC